MPPADRARLAAAPLPAGGNEPAVPAARRRFAST